MEEEKCADFKKKKERKKDDWFVPSKMRTNSRTLTWCVNLLFILGLFRNKASLKTNFQFYYFDVLSIIITL